MNKYVFPGADASASLGWVVNHLEAAGFEVKNVDVLGVHYSATIWHWYNNWVSNKDKVVEKYGDRWYRIWAFFLAWSVIIARCVPFLVFLLYPGADALVRAVMEAPLSSSSRCTRTSTPTRASSASPTTPPFTSPPPRTSSTSSTFSPLARFHSHTYSSPPDPHSESRSEHAIPPPYQPPFSRHVYTRPVASSTHA